MDMNQGNISILPVKWNQIPDKIKRYLSPECIRMICNFSDEKFQYFCNINIDINDLPYSVYFLEYVWEYLSDDIVEMFWFNKLWKVWINKNIEYLLWLDRKTIEYIWKERFLEPNNWQNWWNQNYLIYQNEEDARKAYLKTLSKDEKDMLSLDEIVKLPRALIIFLGKYFHKMNRKKIRELEKMSLEDLELLWAWFVNQFSMKIIRISISIIKKIDFHSKI